MKELSIEQKAERYDKVVNEVKNLRDVLLKEGIINKDGVICNNFNRIFPELVESENERIRKELIQFIKNWKDTNNIGRSNDFPTFTRNVEQCDRYIAYLEKQCEHADFLSKIQVGDKVTRNEDGVLVNLSQLNRVAKSAEKQDEPTEINPSEFDLRLNKLLKQFESLSKEELASSLSFYLNVVQYDGIYNSDEKQGKQNKHLPSFDEAQGTPILKQDEQKLVDKVEPVFEVGDWIISNNSGNPPLHITGINDKHYIFSERDSIIKIKDCNEFYHLWTIRDAKDGDVLATLNDILIYEKALPEDGGVSYCHYDFGCSTPQFNFNKDDNWYFGKEAKVYPATKDQRDTIFAKMKEAGYTFDFEKKELKKIDPNFKVGDWVVYDHIPYQVVELPKEGYINLNLRGNRGEIEFAPSTYCRHWTIQDAKDGDVLASNDASFIVLFKGLSYLEDNIGRFKSYCHYHEGIFSPIEDTNWCCNAFHPATKEQRDTLLKAMVEAGYTFDFKNKELKKIDNNNPMLSNFSKAVYEREKADLQKSDLWSEEDELHIRELESLVKKEWAIVENKNDKDSIYKMRDLSFFLKTLKPQLKQELSEKDMEMIGNIRRIIEQYAFSQSAVDVNGELCEKEYIDADNWLKSLKDRVQLQSEWSEEDEIRMDNLCHFLEEYGEQYYGSLTLNTIITWVKSFRHQNTLKPTKDQMNDLKDAVDAEIVEVEDNNYSMCSHYHLEICTDEDLSKICKAGDKAKVIIIKHK